MTSVILSLFLFFFYSLAAVVAEGTLQSVIRGTATNEGIFGLVQISEAADGSVTVEATVTGLPDGQHGFHVHQYGDIVGKMDGTATGGHYNPTASDHAGPDDSIRHVGDLGNIESTGGIATYSRTFDATDMARPTIVSNMTTSVIGRSFIIHADPDDLTSQPTGNAGSRLAAGVIGIGPTSITEHIESEDFEEPTALVCAIYDDENAMIGSAAIVLNDEGVATVMTNVSSLTSGEHGFHVHEYGEEYSFANATASSDLASLERDLGLAGGHYNPTSVMHGLPPSETRHYGDIGNLMANDRGMATLTGQTLPGVTDLRHLVGRTCLIHADPDDGSDPAGNAGPRIAAGQLGYANPDTNVDVGGAMTDTTADDSAAQATFPPITVAVTSVLLCSIISIAMM